MTASKYFIDILKYNDWADSLIWKTILSNPVLHQDEKIKLLLHHIHTVQYAFYNLWTDIPQDKNRQKNIPGINEIMETGKSFNEKVLLFANDLKEAELDNYIHIPWSVYVERHLGIKAGKATLADTIIQVVNHSSYHRGQVNKFLRALDVDPPMIDYIAWIWFEKPESDWRLNKDI